MIKERFWCYLDCSAAFKGLGLISADATHVVTQSLSSIAREPRQWLAPQKGEKETIDEESCKSVHLTIHYNELALLASSKSFQHAALLVLGAMFLMRVCASTSDSETLRDLRRDQ